MNTIPQGRSWLPATGWASLFVAVLLASWPTLASAQLSLGESFARSSQLNAEPFERLPGPEDEPPAEAGTTIAEAAQYPVFQPLPPGGDWGAAPPADDFWYHAGGKARGYYQNDQRYEFSGAEASFGVEGVVSGGVHQRQDDWEWLSEGEIFVNQRFDRNLLLDSPFRQSFAANFNVDPLQISQLYVAARRGDWLLQGGRFVTPFGRFYFPLYLNNFSDSPFIRSEAILFRETGALVQWDPGHFVFTAALTNGGFDRDANSSKAFIGRMGVEYDHFVCGASVKWQDGIGSEIQKTFNNHAGIDALCRWGKWTLSGEAILDQYGMRRPGFDPNNIFWGRSIYFRDVNRADNKPLNGAGYYINLGYASAQWMLMLNYGDYYPQAVGDARQDTPIHRGLIKASRHFTPNFELYGIALLENSVPLGFEQKSRIGTNIICGVQFSL